MSGDVFKLGQRNSILKVPFHSAVFLRTLSILYEMYSLQLVSQTYRQFTHSRFYECFKMGWYMAKIVVKHPDPFVTPVQFAFGNRNVGKCEDCAEFGVIRCSHCSLYYCFMCFVDRYHLC